LHGGDLKIEVKVKLEGTPQNINIVNSSILDNDDEEEEDGEDGTGEGSDSRQQTTKAVTFPLTPPTTMLEKEIAQTLASLIGQMLAPPTTSILPTNNSNNQQADAITRWYDPGSTLHVVFKVLSSPSTSPILSVLINSATCAMMDTCGVVRMSQTLVSSCILVLQSSQDDDDDADQMTDSSSPAHRLLIDPTMNECQTPNSTVLTIVTAPQKAGVEAKVVSLLTERFPAPQLTSRNADEVPEASGVSMVAMFEAITNASKVCLAVTSVIRGSVLDRGVKESGTLIY
jgi:hypothetical protein